MKPLNSAELESLKEIIRRLGKGQGASQDDIMMALAEAVQFFNRKADRAEYGRATEPLLRQAAKEMGLTAEGAPAIGPAAAPGVVPTTPGAPPTVIGPQGQGPQVVRLPGQADRPIIIQGGPQKPVGEWSPAEMAAWIAAQEKEPKSPIGGPGPEVYAQQAVKQALGSLGTILPDQALPSFTDKLHQEFARIAGAAGAPYTAKQFPQFLDDITRTPMPPSLLTGFEPLPPEDSTILDYLDDWTAQQDADMRAKVEKARLKEQDKATAALKAQQQQQAAQRQAQFQDAQFDAAFNQLKYRYPASTEVLNVMKGELRAGYDEFVYWNSQFATTGSGQPEIDPATGLLLPAIPASGLTPNSWLGGVDMDDFMKRQGPAVYGAWQQTQVQGAFDANIAAPIRGNAKTAADKIKAEEQIGAMASMQPLLLDAYKRAKAADPSLSPVAFMEGREARELVGTAVMEKQREQARIMEQKREVASAMAERGYDVQFIASRLQVSVDQAQQMAQAALDVRQFQIGAASLSQGGMAALPAGEVRGGEFGEISYPQTVQQYVQTPTTAEQLRERDAALNALTGGRYGQAAYQSLVAQSEQFNREAAAQAAEGRVGTLRYKIAQLIGKPSYDVVSNEPELRGILAGLQQKKAADLQKEQYRTAALDVLKPALEDPVFAKELDYFQTKNAKITQAGAFESMPDIYETREQVMVRMAPQVARMYDEYLAKKAKVPPQLPTPTRVL